MVVNPTGRGRLRGNMGFLNNQEEREGKETEIWPANEMERK